MSRKDVMEYVTTLPDGSKPINSVVFQDAIHVATDKGVYVYKNNKWHRIELVEIKELP